jgi:hypothetical protein
MMAASHIFKFVDLVSGSKINIQHPQTPTPV